MAGEVAPRSPWAKRLAIAGALFLVFGAILINSQNEAIDSMYDPREMSLAELGEGNDQNFEVEKGQCYMAIVKQSSPDVTVSLTPIVGGSDAASEPLEPKSCFSDWTPMSSDGTRFVILEQWVPEEKSEMTASSSCSDDSCEEYTVWITHIEDTWMFGFFEFQNLVFGVGICCLGLVLLPLAGLLAYSARSNALHGTIKVVDNDGVLLQSYESQEDLMAALKDSNSPLYQSAATNEPQGGTEEQDGFVDGSRDVMQGTMMTTEQVYGFMRGEIPETTQRVEDPFADSPSPVRQPVKKKVANTSAISDWDSGGGGDEQNEQARPKKSKLKESKKEKSGTDDWSLWDDM